jgi:L-cysteine/cystine lyase
MIIRGRSLVSAAMNDLRAEFPVFERLSYLNAGTNGPVPRRALDAARDSLDRQAAGGRSGPAFFEGLLSRLDDLRDRAARLMGADTAEVALTGSTTDGVNAVLASLELGEGHEVLTSDEEHPGVWAPLMAARERRGVTIRVVPFADLASEVRPETSLVACSHVSWTSGRVVDAAALSAAGAPVLLDGAQALGAVPVDVAALGADFYAASGQKWLCGPNGTGYLFVTRERTAGMPPPWPGYSTLESTLTPFEAVFREDARRFDLGFPGEHQLEWALASIDVLMEAGVDAVHATSRERAAWLAGRLTDAGRTVGPRGDSTLVSWEDPDPEAAVGELLRSGFVLRNLPGTSYVRASVGAWNSEEELERLVKTVTA